MSSSNSRASGPDDNAKPAGDFAAAGAVASGVAPELLRPLQKLRDDLAGLVETLDRHVTTSKGPHPYPWEEVKALRERVAEAYLSSSDVAHLAGDLAAATAQGARAVELAEASELVEGALNLTVHRIAAETELFVDYAPAPRVRCAPGRVVLAIAQLVLASADSARGVQGGAISIRTRREREAGADQVVITVADNGSGRTPWARDAEAWVAEVAEALGGSFAGTAEPGTGTVSEIRLPAGDRRGAR